MDDLYTVLDLSRWLGNQGLTDAEHDSLMTYARENLPPGITSYAQHLTAICMAVERGGQRTLRELVALSVEPKASRELRLALVAWGVARMKVAAKIGETRAFHEDDLFRLREDLALELHKLWPRAHDAKIAGAVGLSTKLAGATLTVDWNTLFRAMQEPDSLQRPGDN